MGPAVSTPGSPYQIWTLRAGGPAPLARRFMGHLRLLAVCPKAPVLTLHLWVEENQVSESAEATGTRPKGMQGQMESIACWFWRKDAVPQVPG